MERYELRRATLADAEAIVRFNAALAVETEQTELDPDTLEAGVERFLSDSTLGAYFVATTDGDPRPAGQIMVTFEFSDWRNGPIWWIQSVYVRPEHRRKGVYRRLHTCVEDAARAAGAVGLRLYVDKQNDRAQATYRSLGMQEARYSMYERFWT